MKEEDDGLDRAPWYDGMWGLSAWQIDNHVAGFISWTIILTLLWNLFALLFSIIIQP